MSWSSPKCCESTPTTTCAACVDDKAPLEFQIESTGWTGPGVCSDFNGTFILSQTSPTSCAWNIDYVGPASGLGCRVSVSIGSSPVPGRTRFDVGFGVPSLSTSYAQYFVDIVRDGAGNIDCLSIYPLVVPFQFGNPSCTPPATITVNAA
jgi:hypothetical protein